MVNTYAVNRSQTPNLARGRNENFSNDLRLNNRAAGSRSIGREFGERERLARYAYDPVALRFINNQYYWPNEQLAYPIAYTDTPVAEVPVVDDAQIYQDYRPYDTRYFGQNFYRDGQISFRREPIRREFQVQRDLRVERESVGRVREPVRRTVR